MNSGFAIPKETYRQVDVPSIQKDICHVNVDVNFPLQKEATRKSKDLRVVAGFDGLAESRRTKRRYVILLGRTLRRLTNDEFDVDVDRRLPVRSRTHAVKESHRFQTDSVTIESDRS